MITKSVLACLLAAGLGSNVMAQSVQTSRYVRTSLALSHYQKDLLVQHISLRFPQSVKTIGEAVDMVLEPSGYRLVSKHKQSEAMRIILTQRLPEALRVIKDVTLSQCLLGLVGHSFQLLFDPVNRLISFNLKPEYQGLYVDKQPIDSGASHVKDK